MREIAKALLPVVLLPRLAQYSPFLDADGQIIDQGLALFFQAPASFTGEDTLELHGHGNPVVLDLLLARVITLGACLARPGEFSERAFLNGKMDLLQAEALADLIDAATAQAARSAMRSLQGEFSNKINVLREELIDLRVTIESTLDFPGEDIDELDLAPIRSRLLNCINQIQTLYRAAEQGKLLQDGLNVAIVGTPNVGKSSLLNQLVRQERAIVTAIPGTTRDPIHASITLAGVPVHLIDTAGVRNSSDAVEQLGMERSWAALAAADVVILVTQQLDGFIPWEWEIKDKLARQSLIVVRNKIDMAGLDPSVTQQSWGYEIFLSALCGTGIELLEQSLLQCAGVTDSSVAEYSARRRHLEALAQVNQYLDESLHSLDLGVRELLAEQLRLAQKVLAGITGEYSTEDLLGDIFSRFCIGK